MTGHPLSPRFTLALEGEIRACSAADLEALEWSAELGGQRALIRDAFARQGRGEVLMLVAEVGGHPAGQLWVDLYRRADAGVGYLWALRVHPLLRGRGIGTRLLAAAEEALRDRAFERAEIGVEAANEGARRLYERLGYRPVRREAGSLEYDTPAGEHVRAAVAEWILQKELFAR